MMKGIVITTDNKVGVRQFGLPLYKTVGKVVGGYIEIVHPKGLPKPYIMIVNEEGLLRDLPLNKTGGFLYQTYIHGYPIVGDIVIMKIEESSDGPDVVGLSDSDIQRLMPEFLKWNTPMEMEGKNNVH